MSTKKTTLLIAISAVLLIAGCVAALMAVATPSQTQVLPTPRWTPYRGSGLQTPAPGYVKIKVSMAKDSLLGTGITIWDATGKESFATWLDLGETITLYLSPGNYTYDTSGAYIDQMPICYHVTRSIPDVQGAIINAIRDDIDIEIRGGNEIGPIPGCKSAHAIHSRIRDVIQGDWIVRQAYNVAGARVWITGTLIIKENSYTFIPSRVVTEPSIQGALDFLFKNPQGELTVTYSAGVDPDDYFNHFATADTLATCAFRVSHAVVGKFLIKVLDPFNLHFDNSSSLWSVIKPLGVDVP